MQDANESSRKVLVVNDEPSMIMLVKLVLESEGFEVSGAYDGQQGLEAIAKDRPDLVLLDTMMPGMHGIDMYRHMKADDSMQDIQVIAVIAWQEDDIQARVDRAFPNVEGYLTIPFSPTDLLNAVNTIL